MEENEKRACLWTMTNEVTNKPTSRDVTRQFLATTVEHNGVFRENLEGAIDRGGNGSHYWCDLSINEMPDSKYKDSEVWVTVEEFGPERDGDGGVYDLTYADITTALDMLFSSGNSNLIKHAGWVLSGNADACTQDLLIQMACFGDIKYG